jgi:DNA-binding protein H-NS
LASLPHLPRSVSATCRRWHLGSPDFGNIATNLAHSFWSSCHLTDVSRCTMLSSLTSFKKAVLEVNMTDRDLTMMSVDELWALHERICAILSTKLDAEMHRLERRLAQLNGRRIENGPRRPHRKVHPKYRNPERPSETWSGRGRQPHSVGAQLKSGKKVDELLIAQTH